MKRSEVKEVHEDSVLKAFQDYNENRVVILDKPEPPDALIEIDGIKNWIEITDAFINPDHARSLTTHVAEDKEWIKSTPTLINVDSFKEILRSVAEKKYNKPSIQDVYKEFGQGILIIGCFSPFHYPINENIEDLADVIKDIYSSNEKIFKEIYVYDYDYKLVKVV